MTRRRPKEDSRTNLWAFDFDGTLSPIVADRSAAALHPECRELLDELAAGPANSVAVISTRSLDDLASRIPVSNLVLMASGGLVWRTESGEILEPTDEMQRRRDHERERLIPLVQAWQKHPGVELEDKLWSMAVHFRCVPPESREVLIASLEAFRVATTVQLRYGPEAAELSFIRRMDKGIALSHLARTLERRFGQVQINYAGDDQNDLPALRYALSCGGTAFVVGDLVSLPQAHSVPDPGSLPSAVRAVMRKKANHG